MESAIIDSILNAASVPHAIGYLDPGTGAMIISAVVGVFATLAMSIKSFWYKLSGVFRRKPASGNVDEKK